MCKRGSVYVCGSVGRLTFFWPEKRFLMNFARRNIFKNISTAPLLYSCKISEKFPLKFRFTSFNSSTRKISRPRHRKCWSSINKFEEKITRKKKWQRFKSREIFLNIFVDFEIFFGDFWDFSEIFGISLRFLRFFLRFLKSPWKIWQRFFTSYLPL